MKLSLCAIESRSVGRSVGLSVGRSVGRSDGRSVGRFSRLERGLFVGAATVVTSWALNPGQSVGRSVGQSVGRSLQSSRKGSLFCWRRSCRQLLRVESQSVGRSVSRSVASVISKGGPICWRQMVVNSWALNHGRSVCRFCRLEGGPYLSAPCRLESRLRS